MVPRLVGFTTRYLNEPVLLALTSPNTSKKEPEIIADPVLWPNDLNVSNCENNPALDVKKNCPDSELYVATF